MTNHAALNRQLLNPISTATRRSDPGNLQAKDLPANIINLQTAASAPDPTGLAAAYGLLGKGDAFKDLTGLAGTQANALGALQTTSKSVTDLAGISKDFAGLAVMANQKKDGAKQIEQIKKLNKDGYLNDDEANQQIKKVLDSYNDASKSLTRSKADDDDSIANKIAEKVVQSGLNSPDQEVEYQKKNAEGETVSIKVSKPETSPDSANKPIIFLKGNTSTAQNRSFNPSAHDISLIITVSADYKNAPTGSRIKWLSPSVGAVAIDNPNAKTTQVRGIIPGLHDLGVALIDAGGVTIASMKLKLSVPQCITVNEDAALFDSALTSIQLTGEKTNIVNEMKAVVEHLHSNTNTRVFWQLAGYTDAVPAHVLANNIVGVTIKNRDPKNLGVTIGLAVGDSFNETIELYPGMYHQPDVIDVDTETQALIIDLEASLGGNPALITLASKIYGRLMGETLSHEIGHALLWNDFIDPRHGNVANDRHNNPAIPNDLMNNGDKKGIWSTYGYGKYG